MLHISYNGFLACAVNRKLFNRHLTRSPVVLQTRETIYSEFLRPYQVKICSNH